MKFIHLSDLHIGKRVNEFSMLEDQKYILTQIIQIVEEEAPDGVLIAGDIYDKSVPSAEAVQLFDDFLCQLAKQKRQVFVISGNHDSPERIAFGSRLMDASGIHLSPVFQGEITPISLEDSYGKVDIFMLPFLKPAHVRRFYEEEEIESYTDALRVVIEHMKLQPEHRSILLTHQFVTGASRSESEELSVGGADNVDASVFDSFDYVALGHIHGPQSIGRETLRYCGTPLKYSFSEAGHKKSVTVVELLEKGTCRIETIPLIPRRDLRELKGTYMELTEKKNYEGTNTEDYIHITLTDEEDIPDAIGKLRVIYPNLMKLDYDNRRTHSHGDFSDLEQIEEKTPLELFSEFYEKQNNQPMNQEQREFIKELMERIWEETL
ncbi:MAG: exonuclease SbcCD subunit D [Lachnospiraceae bacterium]|nr:exonuclease SbcCD subunit D [Lachnospiraceae bacterium]MBP3504994.1 exonuclease SbcCD subunit D [Lachnospiraceae bacterium]